MSSDPSCKLGAGLADQTAARPAGTHPAVVPVRGRQWRSRTCGFTELASLASMGCRKSPDRRAVGLRQEVSGEWDVGLYRRPAGNGSIRNDNGEQEMKLIKLAAIPAFALAAGLSVAACGRSGGGSAVPQQYSNASAS